MRRVLLAVVLLAAAAAPAQAELRIGWQDQMAATNAVAAPTAIAAARFMGAREMRLIIVWNKVQPSANEWHWADYDAAIERARGFNVELVLGGLGARPPAWAGGGPYHPTGEGSWRRLNDRAYVRFVSAAARRYAGRAVLWSILNEADITGYPAARYASLFTRSRRAIRRFAGRRSRVLWGDFSSNAPLGYTTKALAAAPSRVIADGFALHPYAGPFADFQGGLHNLGDIRHGVDSWARRRHRALSTPGHRALPIYATEYGCFTRTYSESECAAQWAQGFAQARRYGLRQLVAYQLLISDHPSWDTSLLRRDGTPSLAMQLIACARTYADARAQSRCAASAGASASLITTQVPPPS